MKLWLRITQGLAALMLSAAAVALLLLAGAILLALAAVLVIAAGGLFLASPEQARRTLTLFMNRMDEWVGEMRAIVERAGELFLTLLAAAGKGPAAEAASQASEESAPDPAPAPRKAPPSDPPSRESAPSDPAGR